MISEFPLFAFTTLAGLSGGAYVAAAVFEGADAGEKKRAWLLPLVCLILLGLGLLGCLGHLGRPLMFMNALANPTSMIAEEAYWSIAFGVVVLADAVLCVTKGISPRALRVVGAVFACGLMVVMANAYFTSHAVAAWTNLATWPLYIVGDLAMGFALYGALDATTGKARLAVLVAVLGALFALTCVAEAIAFSGAGQDAVLFVAGAVIAAVGAIIAMLARKNAAAAIVAFALIFAAVALARYGFYAASVL